MTILDAFKLDNQVALVTGGNRGLGQGMAIALSQAGARVAVTSRSGQAEETLAAITKMGGQAQAFPADFSDPEAGPRVVQQVIDTYGQLDILVANAGTIRRAPALDYPREDWDYVINVNLNAVWLLAQAAARHMAPRGQGKIILIASLLSFQGGITVPAYTASKHGVAGLTKALANEWAALGINVNAIAPGYMATDNTRALQENPTRNRQILERIPAGRWGSPEDLAGAVVFLASQASNYMHGHLLVVDGGWMGR